METNCAIEFGAGAVEIDGSVGAGYYCGLGERAGDRGECVHYFDSYFGHVYCCL